MRRQCQGVFPLLNPNRLFRFWSILILRGSSVILVSRGDSVSSWFFCYSGFSWSFCFFVVLLLFWFLVVLLLFWFLRGDSDSSWFFCYSGFSWSFCFFVVLLLFWFLVVILFIRGSSVSSGILWDLFGLFWIFFDSFVSSISSSAFVSGYECSNLRKSRVDLCTLLYQSVTNSGINWLDYVRESFPLCCGRVLFLLFFFISVLSDSTMPHRGFLLRHKFVWPISLIRAC